MALLSLRRGLHPGNRSPNGGLRCLTRKPEQEPRYAFLISFSWPGKGKLNLEYNFFVIKLSVLGSYAISLWKRDTWRKLNSVDVLFVGSVPSIAEVTPSGLYFDRFLDSIALVLEAMNLSSAYVCRPPTDFKESRHWRTRLRLNRAYALCAFADIAGLSRGRTSYSERLMRKVLKRARPKVVFTTEGLRVMRIAGKKLGIPVVEVLHGRGYSEPEYLTKHDGFARASRSIAADALPSHVLAFDSKSIETFKTSVNSQVKLLQIQDFWFEAFQTEQSVLATLDRFPWKEYKGQTTQQAGQPQVLVSLQWGFSGDGPEDVLPLDDGLLPNGLREAIFAGGTHLRWFIRLHPVQRTSSAPIYVRQRALLQSYFAASENVEIGTETEIPLPLFLSQITHHVTMNSMTCYEVAQFGTPSLVLRPVQGMFTDLILEGYVSEGLDDGSEILNWLRAVKPRAPRENPQPASSLNQVLVTDLALAPKNFKSVSPSRAQPAT